MQSQQDAERLNQLGVDKSKIQVIGNMKFDIKPPENKEIQQALEQWLTGYPCVLVGSSMKGEEELLLDLFCKLKQDFVNLKLIIAPRNPDRFDEVSQIIKDKGFTLCRRTEKEIVESDVFLLDTIGELPSLYHLATLVIIGGSIRPFGGHNIIEAAYFKKPIIVGEFMENFADIVSYFIRNHACIQVPYQNFNTEIQKLLHSEELRITLGENAYKVIEQNLGATEIIFQNITEMLASVESRESRI